MKKKNFLYCNNYPHILEFDISSTCNLKCKLCMRSRSDYVDEPFCYLTLKDFIIILNRFEKLPIVQFCGCCEPTTNPDLPLLIDFAKERGAHHVELFTNGTLLKDEIAQKIAKSKLDMLKVSIDGADAETYYNMRGFDLNRIIYNVKNFKKKSSIKLGIETVVSLNNIESIQKFPALLKNLKADFFELRILYAQVENIEKFAVYDEKEINKLKLFFEKECFRNGIKFYMPSLKEELKNPCAAFVNINVDYKGYVTPCYYLPRKRLKSLFDYTLEDVWNGSEMQRIRGCIARGEFLKECGCCMALLGSKNRS